MEFPSCSVSCTLPDEVFQEGETYINIIIERVVDGNYSACMLAMRIL